MIKKVFLICSILAIIFAIGTISFGANATQDTMNGITGAIGNTVQNAGQAVQNTMGAAGNAVGNTISGVTGTTGNTGNTGNTGVTGTTTPRTTTTRTATTPNTDYTATRTAATIGGLSTTTWTWLVVGITALVIGGLIWYYMAANDGDKVREDR